MRVEDPERQRYIAAHLDPWRRAIARYRDLEERCPGVATKYSTPSLARAERICAALHAGKTGIGFRFADEYGEPDAARKAKQDREAMFRVALRALVDRLIARHDADLTQAELMSRLSRQPLAMPWGIRIDRFGDFQGETPEAKDCFAQHLRNLFAALDEKYGEAGSSFLRALPSDARSSTSEIWGSLWTRAVEAVTLETLIGMGNGTLQGTQDAIWDYAQFPALRQRTDAARNHVALPSVDKKLCLTLTATPVLCQIFQHDTSHWRVPRTDGHDYSRVVVRYRNIHSERSGGTLFYHGRLASHLYLIVLVQRLAEMLANETEEQGMYMNSHPSIPSTDECLPVGLSHELIPAQFKTCSALVALCEGRIERPTTSTTQWFSSSPVSITPSVPSSQRSWPSDVSYLPARHVAVRLDTRGAGDIGVMRLPWFSFGDDVQWVDTTLIVRYAGTWQVLPVSIHEIAAADDDDESNSAAEEMCISLFPEYADRWSVDRLRQAMKRIEWVFRTQGHSAFLAGMLDLDSDSSM